jgi:hypothetical protein
MAFVVTWSWYNTGTTAWVDDAATDINGFFGSTTFGSKITVNAYNVGMHLIDNSTGLDACVADHLTGIQYIAAGTCKVNGGSTVNTSTITTQECRRISLTDGATSISTENSVFYAYDGSTLTNPPTDTTFQCFEQGAASWTAASGSGSALSLADQLTGAVTKYWYIAMSVAPTAVGIKNNKVRFSTDYY